VSPADIGSNSKLKKAGTVMRLGGRFVEKIVLSMGDSEGTAAEKENGLMPGRLEWP
jgi:hypothetical protein